MKRKILTLALIICMLFIFLLLKSVPISKKDIIKAYYVNEYELISICDFLQKNVCSDFRIELFESTKKIICYNYNSKEGFDETIYNINDINIISDLEKLKGNGCIRILKEYNYIYFQMWGSFGESVGLLYSKDNKPNIDEINAKDKFLEEIESKGWYYYYAKFE